jgi:carboxyl-terminal processing protease
MDQFVSSGKGGQLKLTIAKFYRINGGSTQLKGVSPDVEIAGMFDESVYGEAASLYALKWDKIQPAGFSLSRNVNTDLIQELTSAQKERAAKDLAYVNLQEEIDESRSNRSKSFVTLNKALMKEENEAAEARRKMRKTRIGETAATDKASDKKGKKGDEEVEEVPLYEKSDLYFKTSRDIVADMLQRKS